MLKLGFATKIYTCTLIVIELKLGTVALESFVFGLIKTTLTPLFIPYNIFMDYLYCVTKYADVFYPREPIQDRV